MMITVDSDALDVLKVICDEKLNPKAPNATPNIRDSIDIGPLFSGNRENFISTEILEKSLETLEEAGYLECTSLVSTDGRTIHYVTPTLRGFKVYTQFYLSDYEETVSKTELLIKSGKRSSEEIATALAKPHTLIHFILENLAEKGLIRFSRPGRITSTLYIENDH